MDIDKAKIKTLEETDEPAPIDQVEPRVEAEMKRIEGKAKEGVASGLNNEELARAGRRMREDAEGDLIELRNEESQE